MLLFLLMTTEETAAAPIAATATSMEMCLIFNILEKFISPYFLRILIERNNRVLVDVKCGNLFG